MEIAKNQLRDTKFLRDKVFLEKNDTFDLKNQIVYELQMLEEMFDKGTDKDNISQIMRYIIERKDYIKDLIKRGY